mgnify:CR=1 FL=1
MEKDEEIHTEIVKLIISNNLKALLNYIEIYNISLTMEDYLLYFHLSTINESDKIMNYLIDIPKVGTKLSEEIDTLWLVKGEVKKRLKSIKDIRNF